MSPNKFLKVWVLLIGLMLFMGGCAARNIWEASRNGNYDQVKKLLEDHPEQINVHQMDEVPADKGNKWTPLLYAVDHQHERVVKLLLEKGADPLAQGNSGWTPLRAAREGDNPRILKMILDAIKKSGRPMP